MAGRSCSCLKGPVCMQDFATWGERNPVTYCWYLIVIFVLPLAITQFAPLFLQSAVSRNLGTVGLAAFEAIRAGAGWLESLQTSLWYVQMSRISFLEGAGRYTEAGGMVLLSTLWTLVAGALLCVIGLAIANPLMDVLSPAEMQVAAVDNVSVIKSIGLTAMIVYCFHIPPTVGFSNFSGVAQGMRVVFTTFFPYMVIVIVAELLIVVLASNVPCGANEKAAAAAAAAANQTYEPFATPCAEATDFLVLTSVVAVALQWVGTIFVAIFCYLTAKSRGYFKEHGFSICKYFKLAKDSGLFGKDFLQRLASVSMRSIVNNSRGILGIIAAIRMGTVDAAVYILADSIGDFTYTVPNTLASGSMMIATRCYGNGDTKSALKIIHMFICLGVVSAVVFTGLAVVSESIAPAVWVSELEREEVRHSTLLSAFLMSPLMPAAPLALLTPKEKGGSISRPLHSSRPRPARRFISSLRSSRCARWWARMGRSLWPCSTSARGGRSSPSASSACGCRFTSLPTPPRRSACALSL